MPAKRKKAADNDAGADKKGKTEAAPAAAAAGNGAAVATAAAAAAPADGNFERLSSFFKNDLKEKVDEKSTHELIQPSKAISKGARVKSMAAYLKLYEKSIGDKREQFWADMAKETIEWFKPFDTVTTGGFVDGDVSWFNNGKLNVCFNCVDRHAVTHPNKTAILWEGDDAKNVRPISYSQLLKDVCRVANVLKRLGVRKGDAVCLYMPMIPEAAIAMLACTRIGAPHSVVFAGFSADALRDRILDGQCRYVITADEGIRGGKAIPLKSTVDKALSECPDVAKVLVFKHSGGNVNFKAGRDVWAAEAMAAERPYCPCEWMDSEDPLFFLYTSGSTGKPKGILHTTGGYLLYAAMTHSHVFDIHDDDVYGCMADIGWVTGHSYIVYGPLCNRSTTFLFEGSPLYPTPSRYWEMVERHKLTIVYTAPTAIRSLMKFGKDPVLKHDRSSLRVLGSVGEPINPEAWRWYYEVVGNSKCAVVDTFWQTETGGIMITPLPGCTPMKPGSATFPFFGIDPVLVDEKSKVVEGNDQKGVLCFRQPWPGMARTIYGDHQRFMNTYLNPYKGFYFTGDGSTRDADGYYWITGRVDDVVNVSGHRIGSAEIESALVSHKSVAESAVIGIPHDVKGQALFAYVTTKNSATAAATGAGSGSLHAELQLVVRKEVGGFALPDEILICPALPKTRSGKIMRRILRKIAEGDTSNLGDITTLADPSVVADLIAAVAKMRADAKAAKASAAAKK